MPVPGHEHLRGSEEDMTSNDDNILYKAIIATIAIIFLVLIAGVVIR